MKRITISSIGFLDVIDVVKDGQPVTAADYVREEEPCIYVSRVTGRGPLSETWIQDYWRECKVNNNTWCNFSEPTY